MTVLITAALSAAAVRPIHEVEGNSNCAPPPESTSLEISTHIFAQVITTLPTIARVQLLVMFIKLYFPSRMRENFTSYSSFPTLSYLTLSYFILAFVQGLKALTEFNA